MPEIKIVEVEQPCRMIATITVACSQLLKYIHINKLEIIVLVDMVSKANQKTVLIKIIIDDLLTKLI